MRVKVGWRSASKENYKEFCNTHPNIHISYSDWAGVIYAFNESFRNYLLETGDKLKLPSGFGDFSIIKKYRAKFKTFAGKERINLPIDWIKTREKGKIVYNMNYHSEGYFFGWKWFKSTARFKFTDLWYFKPSRVSSRLIAHYIKVDEKYQHIYKEWKE
jgi:hypothetical protein